MLCDKCLNKNICKYFAFFADAPMQITIENCEKYVSNIKPSVVHQNPNDNVSLLHFKEPIDYSKFNLSQSEPEVQEDEERITVDLTEEHNCKITSITDLLLGDDE
jgi:hypothetical protein